jgi:hypothetical protein
MMEMYFQKKDRSTLAEVSGVSALMFIILTCSIALILRVRDVH